MLKKENCLKIKDKEELFKSASRRATLVFILLNNKEIKEEKVVFPTPPFAEHIMTKFFI